MPTTQDALYREITSQLNTAYTAAPHSMSGRVHMSLKAEIDGRGRQTVQVVPGSAESMNNQTDPTAIVLRESFTVMHWTKMNLDQGRHSDQVMAKATSGILAMMTTSRQALVGQRLGGLTHRFLSLTNIEPHIAEVPSGWVAKGDVYEMFYEIATVGYGGA